MPAQPTLMAFLPNLGFPEMVVIAIVALLIFGRRLPEVGRSVGKSIVEFKKGLKEAEDTINEAGTDSRSSGSTHDTDAKNKDADNPEGTDKSNYKLT